MRKRNTFEKLHLFGLNVKMVNNILDQVENKHNSEIENINEKIESIKSENEYLKKQLTELKNENQTELKSKQIMEYSLKKAVNYTSLFSDVSKREVSEITYIGQKTEMLFNEKIEEFDITIKETQLVLDMLLKEVLNKNDKLNERLESFMERNGSVKFLLSDQERKNKQNNIEIEQKRNIRIEAPVVKQEAQIESKKQLKFAEEGVKSVFNEAIKESENVWTESAVIVESSVNKSGVEVKDNKVNDVKNDLYKVPSSEINNLRNKYLVGKITGGDILNKNGQIMVSQNTLITNDIIDKVEREGKLVDLIVNITIPEIKI